MDIILGGGNLAVCSKQWFYQICALDGLSIIVHFGSFVTNKLFSRAFLFKAGVYSGIAQKMIVYKANFLGAFWLQFHVQTPLKS